MHTWERQCAKAKLLLTFPRIGISWILVLPVFASLRLTFNALPLPPFFSSSTAPSYLLPPSHRHTHTHTHAKLSLWASGVLSLPSSSFWHPFTSRPPLPLSLSHTLSLSGSRPLLILFFYGLWLVSRRRRRRWLRSRCSRRSFAVALFGPRVVLKGGSQKRGCNVDLSQFLFCSRTWTQHIKT